MGFVEWVCFSMVLGGFLSVCLLALLVFLGDGL